MNIIIDLLIIWILFLIQAAFVLLVTGPLILLKPVRRRKEWYARSTSLLQPTDAGLPQEECTVETIDGVRLSCWLVQQPHQAKGTIIYLHGVGDCKIGGIPFAQSLYSRGFHLFLYDSRAHGESEGDYCTYGFYEKHDVTSILTYLRSRTDFKTGKIGVYGTSMGAAVAIQAAAIDQRIMAIVAEGSYSSLRTIFVDYQKRIIKLPWHFLRNIALVQSQKLANFKARLVSPLDDIARIRIPVCIVHGTNDTFIKPEYSTHLFDAAHEPKQLMLIEQADHNNVWEAGGPAYADAIASFFEKHFTR